MKQRNLTVACEFGEIPVHQRNMFAVMDGMPLDATLSHAACIVVGLREMASDGIQTNGISANMAWLMEANLDALFALLTSIEGGLPADADIIAEAQA